ncbi:MAG TPA: PH domain-containing protein [Thermoanaerobaculia bacterium]|nr:PH domain-containing protein [Thermoanaerobaculia bacterium]
METVFTLVPPPGKTSTALWVPAVLVLVVSLAGILVVSKSLSGARSSTFTLSPAGLVIRGDLWGRTIPTAQLRGALARVVDLRVETALAPRRRTAGTGLPGYRSGWWRLANGEKALIYVTTTDRVVHVPTTAAYSLLLSVSEPERFAAQLRELSPAG